MKKISAIAIALCAVVLTASAEKRAVELSLWSPSVQLQDTTDDISGVRLALYGENRNMTGLDLGIWQVSTGEFNGLQLSWLYSRTEGDFNGFLDGGIVSRVRGEMYGVDLSFIGFIDSKACGLVGGFYSQVSSEMKGLQLGFVNNAAVLNGLQLGLVNYAKSGYGLQIGLVNIFGDGFLPVFPIVNFNF